MTVALTRAQVRRVDQLAIDRYGIPGAVLMENAGRNAAEHIRAEFGVTGHAIILCGTGNNGGDGFVIARHLHNVGWQVRLLIAGDLPSLSGDALVHYRIVEAMGLDITIASDAKGQQSFLQKTQAAVVVVDALLGTGFRGDVRERTAELIRTVNASPKRAVVAIDVPSGMDCDTGAGGDATICADLTVTFVAPKVGFAAARASTYVGRVEVADIGVPPELIEQVLRGESEIA